MIRTRGVSHIELTVRDIERSIEFYGDVFGFELVGRPALGAVLQTPGSPGSLSLAPVEDDEPVRITHFGLALADPADLDRALALVRSAGGTVLTRVRHAVGGASAVVADPTGHRIAL